MTHHSHSESTGFSKRTIAIVSATAVVGALAALATTQHNSPSGTFLQQKGSDYQAKLKFNQFLSSHNKNYLTQEEYDARFEIFHQNLAIVQNHDAAAEGFSIAINAFSDLSQEEFSRQKLGFRQDAHTDIDGDNTVLSSAGTPILSVAASIDWRASGAVSTVKNQGQCGSCYSFSASGAMEGAYKIKYGQLYSFSEQQLMDCSGAYGNGGCGGGSMTGCFSYLQTHKHETESSYPYQGYQGQCKYNSALGVVNTRGYVNVNKNDPNAHINALQIGPVSIAMDASSAVFQMYSSGILNSSMCGTSLDHGVLLVGYGADASGN